MMSVEMKVTQEEMAEAKVPLNLRDYCAHLFIPLMKCRKENYYLPWRCTQEKHAWDECEFQEYVVISLYRQNACHILYVEIVGLLVEVIYHVCMCCVLNICLTVDVCQII